MREYERPPAVGGSSLLVIFAVLCLTIFALLSLSTVEADGRLTKASAEAVREYYEADTEAEEMLSLLRQGIVPAGVTREGEIYCYRCEISGVRALEVAVRIRADRYEILKWNVVSTESWEPDEEIEVWNGGA